MEDFKHLLENTQGMISMPQLLATFMKKIITKRVAHTFRDILSLNMWGCFNVFLILYIFFQNKAFPNKCIFYRINT